MTSDVHSPLPTRLPLCSLQKGDDAIAEFARFVGAVRESRQENWGDDCGRDDRDASQSNPPTKKKPPIAPKARLPSQSGRFLVSTAMAARAIAIWNKVTERASVT